MHQINSKIVYVWYRDQIACLRTFKYINGNYWFILLCALSASFHTYPDGSGSPDHMFGVSIGCSMGLPDVRLDAKNDKLGVWASEGFRSE